MKSTKLSNLSFSDSIKKKILKIILQTNVRMSLNYRGRHKNTHKKKGCEEKWDRKRLRKVWIINLFIDVFFMTSHMTLFAISIVDR